MSISPNLMKDIGPADPDWIVEIRDRASVAIDQSMSEQPTEPAPDDPEWDDVTDLLEKYIIMRAQLITATARAESAERVVEAVAPIAELIELVENRAMACDGPVTPTFQAMERGERAAFENRLGNLIHAYRALRLSRDGGQGDKT